VSAASMQVDYDDEVCFHAVRALYDHARTRRGDPFFLVASFTHPHDPWELPARWWERYDPAGIDLPAVPAIPWEEADPHSRRLRAMSRVDAEDLTDAQIRRARHAYYAAISYVDDRIGQVLGALRESGLEDDTIVLLTADHGEMLGERGLWYKMAFFEDAARVPLIVRAPAGLARAGERVAEPVSLLDVAPTLLDLAGLDASDLGAIDGRSLGPVLRGEGRRGAPVVAEYLAEGVNAPMVMVRDGALKYIRCPGDPDVLYDLDADPRELRNLADGTEDGAEARLRAEADRRWDLGRLEAAILDSQRERRLVVPALNRGRHTAWDYVPQSQAMRYIGTNADLYELQRRARLDTDDRRAS